MFGLFDTIAAQPNWVIFAGLAAISAIIVIAGSKLSELGDELSEVSGLSSTWIGIIFLSVITSIPEVAASITATLTNAADLGIGNVFGSNMFNITIIALLDVLQGPGPVMMTVSATQILPAALGIFLMGLGAVGIYASTHIGANDPASGNFIGYMFSFFIFVTWVFGMFISYKSEQTAVADDDLQGPPPAGALRSVILRFVLMSSLVVIAGIFLVGFAETLATRTFVVGGREIMLGGTFVGTIIVASLTSLPELVVSIAAYRIGAVNMSVANILGSNTFNMTIISIMELFAGGTSVLFIAQMNHVITAGFAIILTAIVIIGIIYRSRKSFMFMGLDALGIAFFYLLGAYLIFRSAVVVH